MRVTILSFIGYQGLLWLTTIKVKVRSDRNIRLKIFFGLFAKGILLGSNL